MQGTASRRLAKVSSTQTSPANQRRLVLCIDDESLGLTTRKLILEQAGYQVEICADGSKGLEMFSSKPVDIVVLDYEMPGLNGLQVAERMKELKPEVPIIMLSAHQTPPEGSGHLLNAYLVKGEGPDVMLASLQQILQPIAPTW